MNLDINTNAYSICRNCKFFNIVINDDRTGGNHCFFCKTGNYIPFTVVNSQKELRKEISEYKDDPLPDECPYYSQSCMAVFSGEDETELLIGEEWKDYSRLVKSSVSDANTDSPIFSYVKEMDPRFQERMKEDGDCWLLDDGGETLAFMQVALEGDEADYSHIMPAPKPPLFAKGRKRLRISNLLYDTEKAPFTGEGLLKKAFLTALEAQVDEIYAVTYSNCPACSLFARSGFLGGYWNVEGDNDDAAQSVFAMRLDKEK